MLTYIRGEKKAIIEEKKRDDKHVEVIIFLSYSLFLYIRKYAEISIYQHQSFPSPTTFISFMLSLIHFSLNSKPLFSFFLQKPII
jgi:hypothetical protein